MKTLRWTLGMMLLMPLSAVSTQAQQDVPPASPTQSPADAAAAAKADAAGKTKKARVWDNENIPKAGDEISVVGQPVPDQSNSSSNSGSDANSGGAPAPTSSGDDKGKEKKEEAKIDASKGEQDERVAAAREKLNSLKRDLDLQSRKLDLDSQTYFGKPDYKSDPGGAEQLQTEKDSIASKQAEVDAAQKELDDLLAQLGGAPANTPNLPN
jgi:hypothetical protein